MRGTGEIHSDAGIGIDTLLHGFALIVQDFTLRLDFL